MYSLSFLFHLLCFVFETGSHVSRAALELIMQFRMASTSNLHAPPKYWDDRPVGVTKIVLHVC